jgi:hypothetical protein
MVLAAVVAVARTAGAQDTVITGTITDASDAVLPGVTVTAQHADTGNTFSGVTDGSGVYRIGPVRPGVYTVTAELPGFASMKRENLELLLGQRVVLDLRMALTGVAEAVTVTGAAPLIDVTQSRVGGNIDTRQMQVLPINGRDWKQLTMLAPGARANAVGEGVFGNVGSYQLNMDGQEVTNGMSYGNVVQPKFSRESIGEFEMVTARFDVTQGRSRGVMVNAISKSGTNTPAGTAYGYFRDDKLNAADFIARRVLPYSNQQTGFTFGGPIRKDKIHFFVNYEYEREPFTLTTDYPLFASAVPALFEHTNTQHMTGGRVDWQLSEKTRLMFRGNYYRVNLPSRFTFGATLSPSGRNEMWAKLGQGFATLTQVLSGRTVNEIKGGIATSFYEHGTPYPGLATGPRVNLRGYTIGGPEWIKQHENKIQVRDDLTANRGTHEIKIGGEFNLPLAYLFWPSNMNGSLDATLGPVPASAPSLFPVWNDASTWNLAPLSSITRSWSQAFGNGIIHCADPGNPSDCRRKKPQIGGWVGDNWRVTSDLTLNLGVRWDFIQDAMANDFVVPPIRGKMPQEWTNFGPRVGFAYSVSPKTVLRGGTGKFYAGVVDAYAQTTARPGGVVDLTVFNDGRPDFAADPWNVAGGGHVPTYEEARQLATNLSYPGIAVGKQTYAYQTSAGVQRQLAESVSIQADYVWIHTGNERRERNINLAFNPATGANYPFTNPANRPFPQYGALVIDDSTPGLAYSNLHALELGLTKRFSQRWQAGATYTLSSFKEYTGPYALFPGCQYVFTRPGSTDCSTPIQLTPDFAATYEPGAFIDANGANTADQRHRAVVNAIVQLPYGLQISSLYFYGSGERFTTNYGADLRDHGPGGIGSPLRLRADGTIIPKNNFAGRPLHRVDLSLRKRVPLGGPVALDAVAEVFNLFNHENYGSYTLAEVNPRYGLPSQNINVAYQPRRGQFGFKLMF